MAGDLPRREYWVRATMVLGLVAAVHRRVLGNRFALPGFRATMRHDAAGITRRTASVSCAVGVSWSACYSAIVPVMIYRCGRVLRNENSLKTPR